MMQPLKKILVAVDLEETTERVLHTAVLLAKTFDSRLVLLHVIPDLLPGGWADQEGHDLVAVRLSELKRYAEQEGVAVDNVAVVGGKASYHICQTAEHKGVSLILVGATRGRKKDIHLGVTAVRVLRNSVKPVWIVAQREVVQPRSIICPVDGSPASHRALENAIRLAKQFEARLTVLKVSESMPEVYARMMRPDHAGHGQLKQVRTELEALVRSFGVDELDVDVQVREGSPHGEIFRTADEVKSDLIVMGTEGMSNQPRSLIGSVTQKVARAMPCSVVAVNDEDVLSSRLNAVIEDILSHMNEAKVLLASGNPVESLAEYEQCLLDEPSYAPAWEGMAVAYEQLGDLNKADRCRAAARKIRDTLLD